MYFLPVVYLSVFIIVIIPEDEDSSSSDSESEEEVSVPPEIVEKSLLTTPLSGAMGEWEKHTKVLIS